ncbi:O-fucosyltransferase family protein [Auraticoccus monumenti]|uniref:Uncharacterized protein n=1 Tax=Auraticoccus monumenti TaxID=675864 RepID=A0A1G6VTV7_9ACTN|nr:hypothetical protein [Auraticoccus monumenti]SDD56999.1 hypothetical protein SAMN04489747_1255 [Auraticoccus monumenti]
MSPHERRRLVIAVTRPYHGLGNRMRVVFGAKALADSTGRGLRFVWSVGKPFGARLDQLWEVRDRPLPRLASRALTARYPYRDEKLAWLDGATEERVWQIRTAHALHLPEAAGPWERTLQQVPPVAGIRDAVTDFHTRDLGRSPYVGVMVRAHPVSHQETLLASPVEWYIARLRALRSQHPALRFFVSADSPEAAARIAQEVPGCVSLKKTGGYNTRVGLQEAVTDLYLLASSSHLVGPHFSSFPELAQRLAGPGLRLETSRTAPEHDFDPEQLSTPSDPTRPHERQATSL